MTKKISNIDKQRIKKLKTADNRIVIEELKDLRKSGNNTLLQEIMDLLKTNPDEEVRSEIFKILNNLNEQSSSTILMNKLPDFEDEDFFSDLVSSCWQNGLDYSDYLEYFIKIALEKDYIVAFEALTVIEGDINNLQSHKREQLAKKIESSKQDVVSEKLSLIEELQKMVEPFSGPFSVDDSP
jgi:hypothetical protein